MLKPIVFIPITVIAVIIEIKAIFGKKYSLDIYEVKEIYTIGLFFDATWEEEHGAGVLMAGFDVLDTGNQDHAYYTYALH